MNFSGEGWRSWQKIFVQHIIRYYCFIFVTWKNNHYLFVVFPSRLFYATLLLNFFSKSWHKSTFLAFSLALRSILLFTILEVYCCNKRRKFASSMFSLVLLRKLATHKAQIGLFFNYEVNKTYTIVIGKMTPFIP